MGNFASLFFVSRKEMRILMVGLDAAGKTTILHKLDIGLIELRDIFLNLVLWLPTNN